MSIHADVVSPFAPRVEKSVTAIRDALDDDLRVEFDAAVDTLIKQWWPRAQLCAQPGGRDQVEAAFAALERGDPVATVPFDLDGDGV